MGMMSLDTYIDIYIVQCTSLGISFALAAPRIVALDFDMVIKDIHVSVHRIGMRDDDCRGGIGRYAALSLDHIHHVAYP